MAKRRGVQLLMHMEHFQELLGLPPQARVLGVFQDVEDIASARVRVVVDGAGHETLPGAPCPAYFMQRDQDGKLTLPREFFPITGEQECNSAVENTSDETGPERS